MKKKKKSKVSLIIKINDNISIFANVHQYIVKFCGQSDWHLPTLQSCFEEIFDAQVKLKLMENDKKDMQNIIRIIKETKKELLALFRGCELRS